MIRALPFCAALFASVLVSQAREGPDPETVFHLTLQPAGEPKPALRYQLLPELPEMNPGNAVPGYLKCFMEQSVFFFGKEAVAQREKWSTMPLKDLPVAELRNYGGAALRQADYAARLEIADWQTLIPLRREGILLLIPDVAQMRTLATALRVRLRGEIAQRRFDDAVVTLKTLFGLSRHLAEHPTLIGSLVGVSIALQTTEALGEMIEQPGSPNLYWALTALPTPLIDLRKGTQGERVFLAGEFRDIDAQHTMGEAQMQKVVKRAQELHDLQHEPKPPARDVQAWLAERAGNATTVAAARARLVTFGVDEQAAKQFPALQVVLLDERFLCEARRDAAEKVMALPFWQAQTVLNAMPPMPDKGETLYADLVPAYAKVQRAAVRLEQRVALLRCVEALRLHAAAHAGKLPAALADAPVPMPVDPVTGTPFLYRFEAGVATIRGTPPPGMEKFGGYSVRYEIQIAK
jgi:hypothetical protein